MEANEKVKFHLKANPLTGTYSVRASVGGEIEYSLILINSMEKRGFTLLEKVLTITY